MRNLFKSAWIATIEVGMATWAVIRKHKSTLNPKQAKMAVEFKGEWCKNNVFTYVNETI